MLHVRRATLRPDLAILTIAGIWTPGRGWGIFSAAIQPYQVSRADRRLKVKDVKSVPCVSGRKFRLRRDCDDVH